MKNTKPNYKGFMVHLEQYNEKGVPHGMSDLHRLAKIYGTPVPIGFDDNNNPIFRDEPKTVEDPSKIIDD
jgi:hypothetical protein